jgi:hypothetical protein
MTRSILAGLLGLFSIAAVGALPLACQSGGIGDPCIPEDEYSADFAGFKVTEENIESRSFQCSTRICLVNHFQGRGTCPFGQGAPTICTPVDLKNPGHDKGTCGGADEMCVEAAVFADACVPGEKTCPAGTACDETRKVCACISGGVGKEGYHCLPSNPADAKSVSVFKSFVCHKPGICQTADSNVPVDGDDQAGTKTKAKFDAEVKKACCVPGTDTPTTTSVCGQCAGSAAKKSTRSAAQSVYCSCRCGVADGATDLEPNFNFCECPTGFSCSQVRPDVGIGDHLLTGKYCVKEATEYLGNAVTECGKVIGNRDSTCEGTN